MTDPDQAFRRGHNANLSGDNEQGVPEQSSASPGASHEQLILDPELHPSVWARGQGPSGGSQHGPTRRALSTQAKRRRTRTAIIAGALGVALALVAAVVVPRLLHTPTWRSQPLVVDFSTRPEIAWSSAGGQPCATNPDADQAILSDNGRVWSLDLSTGQTTWSVALEGHVTCLPEADLVAVTMTDAGNGANPGTTLLSTSTGAEVAQLPGESTSHVIPLGSNIGLVDDTNMLRAVHPEDLDSPVWSRQLLGPPDELGLNSVKNVDDHVVQITYFAGSDSDGLPQAFTLTVATADGTSPAWSRESTTGHIDYQRFGDVIVMQENFDAFSVVDLEGEELWDPGDDQVGIAGSRLYRAWPSSSDTSTGYTNLHRINPLTGSPIGGDSYQGWFDYTVAAKDHVAVLRGGTLYILDKYLQEQPALTVEGFHAIFEGDKWVYTWSDPERDDDFGGMLSAIDPDGERVVWTMELDSGQFVGQLGRHLVVVDWNGDAIHGLKSSS